MIEFLSSIAMMFTFFFLGTGAFFLVPFAKCKWEWEWKCQHMSVNLQSLMSLGVPLGYHTTIKGLKSGAQQAGFTTAIIGFWPRIEVGLCCP
jgi:hypothetical protein